MWMEAHQIDARARHSRVPLEPIVRSAGRSHRSPVEVIVGLQRLAGNQAVSSLMRNRPAVQRVRRPSL